MKLIKLILIVILIILCGTILYQNQVLNPYPVIIWLYPGYQVEVLLPIVIAMVLIFGSCIGFIVSIFQIVTYKRESLSLRSENRRLQVELDSLRNQSIEDDLDIQNSIKELNE